MALATFPGLTKAAMLKNVLLLILHNLSAHFIEKTLNSNRFTVLHMKCTVKH